MIIIMIFKLIKLGINKVKNIDYIFNTFFKLLKKFKISFPITVIQLYLDIIILTNSS
jgi:hypothetical protein